MKEFVESGKYTIKIYETLGFKLIESIYPAKLRMPRHRHNAASFCFVLDGAYFEKFNRKSQLHKTSTLNIYPVNYEHEVDFANTEVRTLDVLISPERFRQTGNYSNVLNYPETIFSSEAINLTKRLYREFSRIDDVSQLAIEGIILEILAESSRSSSSGKKSCEETPRWIIKVDDFLHDNFSKSLTIEEVASVANVHPVHLARVFRKRFNCTIGEYVRGLRVDFACQQLSSSNTPLSEIALSAGFADQSHFTRTFKAALGVTPTKYRNISGSY